MTKRKNTPTSSRFIGSNPISSMITSPVERYFLYRSADVADATTAVQLTPNGAAALSRAGIDVGAVRPATTLTMPTTLQIRPALTGDIERIIALMPRLAAFEVPAHREPDSLWLGDADMLRDWASRRRDDLVVHVVVDAPVSTRRSCAATSRSKASASSAIAA